LRRNCLVEQVIGGKMEERIEVKERRKLRKLQDTGN